MISFLKDLLSQAPEADPDREVRVAAASLLLKMTQVDSNVEEAELHTVRTAVQKLLDLADSQVDQLLEQAKREVDESVSLYDFTKILHHQQTKEQKQHLVRLLWSVAIADGEVDPQEELLVRKVAGLLYLKQEEFIAAKKAAMAEAMA